MSGSTPTSRTSSPARASARSRCRKQRSSSRSTGCATRSPTPPTRARTAAPISPMRSTCWRATASAPIGDLRYIADAKLDALSTPIAKAQIAAALAMAGDRTRAERVFAAALDALAPASKPDLIGREDYGSTLARCGGGGRARERRRRAARHGAGGGAARRIGARQRCARPRRRKMRGFCSRRARWRRTAARYRSMSAARRCNARFIAPSAPAI